MHSFAALAFLALAALPVPTSAHLSGGRDVIVDGYVIDFGHDPERPVAGRQTTIALNLIGRERSAPIEPSSVWVRISTDRDVLFAGVLKPEPANVTFTYVFPAAGSYEIKARFVHGREEVVETQFPLEVTSPEAAEEAEERRSGAWAVAAVFVVAGALLLVSKRRPPARHHHH